MSGKKLINQPESVVDEALDGLTFLNPGIRRIKGHRVVLRDQIDKNKVALLSGGGSGHEPFCGGYVGAGMLTAGVAGSVFASPPTSSILEGIRAIAKENPAGALVIVINYTGDRINFGLAIEKARMEKLKVEMFVNGEDCSLTTSDKTAGRRGLCGTLFIFKIAGAMAERGQSLESILQTTRLVSANMGTMGLALEPCSLPGQGPLFKIGPGEVEIGLGVHGEAGVGRAPLLTACDAVKTILDHMTNPNSSTKIELTSGEQVAVILNNLGGTSKLEELVITREIVLQLEARGVQVVRMYAGHLMTSLEMSGILISLLKVTGHAEWLDCLDEPTTAPAWPVNLMSALSRDRFNPPPIESSLVEEDDWRMKGVELSAQGADVVRKILELAATSLINMEDQLNQLDSECGDGDCGSTHAIGAKALLEAVPELNLSHPWILMQQLGNLCEKMGGSSGGVYSLLFTGAANAFQDQMLGSVDPLSWVRALRCGLDTVMSYGGAEPGDRTMIDALHPGLLVLESSASTMDLSSNPSNYLKAAAAASTQGAQDTAKMVARAGRASYVSRDKVNQPDPGAVAASTWFNAIQQVLCNYYEAV